MYGNLLYSIVPKGNMETKGIRGMEAKLVVKDKDPSVLAPGTLMHRAQWLGSKDVFKSRLEAYREEMTATRPLSLRILEDEVYLHDFVAIFSATGELTGVTTTAASVEKGKERARALLPASLTKYNIQFDKWVTRNADIFVSVAASGDLRMLEALVSFAEDAETVCSEVDWPRVVEVASLNGHQGIIDSVASSPLISERANAVTEGSTRALVHRAGNEAMGSEMNRQCAAGDRTVPVEDCLTSTYLYLKVLTSSTIMATVRSYRESPTTVVSRFQWRLCTEKPVQVDQFDTLGKLPRIAIVWDDLDTLKSLYYASRHLDLPKISFHNAMHIAACEGRLEILQWLHTLPDGDHKCRPDTMAMAVRGGYSEVVTWLHTHCPESEQSMSRHAINAAARSGLVDVLRTCLRLGLGEFTSEAFYQAAQYGQLPVLRLLYGSDVEVASIDFKKAMKYALEGSHLPVVEWLHTDRHVRFDSELLVVALQMRGERASECFEYIRRGIDPSTNWVASCASEAFESTCATGCTAAVQFVLVHVATEDRSTITRGLLAAIRQAAAAQPSAPGASDPTLRFDVIRLLLPLCAGDGATLGAALKLAVQMSFDLVVEAILATEGDIPSADFRTAFELAVTSARRRHLSVLIKHKADVHCPDALVLLVQHRAGTDAIDEIFPRRTKDASIRALQTTGDKAHRHYAMHLLKHEDQHYTERVLWERLPASLASSYIRYLLKHGREKDADAMVCYAGVLQENANHLTVEDVDALMALNDPEVNGLVSRFRGTLFNMKALWPKLNHIDNKRAMQYLSVDIPMTTNERRELLVDAMATFKSRIVEALYDPALCTVSVELMAAQVRGNRLSFVATLLDHHHTATDDVIYSVLLAQLQSRASDSQPKIGVDIGSSLVLLLVEKRPHSHQRLLEIAAEAGAWRVLEYMLNTRSWFRTTPLPVVDRNQLRMLPAMAAAARCNEANCTHVTKMLYEARNDDDEPVTVTRVRELAGIGAESVLLPLLEQWDVGVRAELTQERLQSAALFGIAPSSKSPTKKRRDVSKK